MKELRQQFVNALLAVLTVAAVIAAARNFEQQGKFRLADDGVTWVDHRSGPESNIETSPDGTKTRVGPAAAYVVPDGPGDRAGIHKGDVLVSISRAPVNIASDATRILQAIGPWNKAEYKIQHGEVEVPANVVVGEVPREATLYFQYLVAIAYLGIGVFVYVRRRQAPRALHFFLLCLSSFILYAFHYTGKLNPFDTAIYLGNVIAWFLAPTLFVHFCFSFPEQQKWIRRKGAALLLYLPGLALLVAQAGFFSGWLSTSAPLIEVRWLLDRIWLAYLCGMYLAGAAVLARQMKQATDAIVRSQLAWLRNGAIVAVLPFTIIYAIPYMLGLAPNTVMNLSVLTLLLIPITWSYAVLRYRLMDVDIIFEQGAVYTLATLSVLAGFYGLIFSLSGTAELNGPAMVAMILVAAFVFQPVRNWIREQLDRYFFYKDRYDYRRTLIEFARELGSPTDLHAMLETVADRLIRTLSVRHAAIFVLDETDGKFHLELAENRAGDQTTAVPPGLDMSFLSPSPDKPYLFFERTRHAMDIVSNEMSFGVRRSIAELELTYYLPCAARGRTIAYIGVSRTETGDFLSSDDIQLLVTLSGYVGIAVDNSRLYASLQRKADEYERLKEFSENIVESIHVGILAVDLYDRIESWNSQMEKVTGVARRDALGQPMAMLFPESLCEQLEISRGESGTQNLYKYFLQSRGTTLNIATAPLFSKDGARIGRLIIFDDVTDRAELERRLVQADKLSSIGLLAAGVAHEVNTPLAVISTYAQMLAKQISSDDEKAPLLEKIARQTFRASEIVNSLLNFSRVAPTQFVSVDLNKCVRESLGLVEHQLQKAGVQVELSLDETLGAFKGSAGKLQQVLLNLVMNARDAMEQGGTLRIETARIENRRADTGAEDPVLRVIVQDTGDGIDPAVLPRIFDPFFTTKGARRGTGLGLAVSYGIIQEHGGEISVESELGQGTKFVLTFPVVVSNAVMGAKPPRVRPAETTGTVFVPGVAAMESTTVARASAMGVPQIAIQPTAHVGSPIGSEAGFPAMPQSMSPNNRIVQ